MGEKQGNLTKLLISIAAIVFGIYWYSLEFSISGTGITNFQAISIAFKAVFGVFITLIGIFAGWTYWDRLVVSGEDGEEFKEEYPGDWLEEEAEDQSGDFLEEDSDAEPTEGSKIGEGEPFIFDYNELVSGTVDEVKEEVKNTEAVDLNKVLEAEKAGKDRKTLKKWLRSRKNN